MAAWLSAQVVAADLLPDAERLRIIAQLVSIAASEATMLDLVMGRWIYMLGSPGSGLQALVPAFSQLSQRTTVRPTRGSEAGVA